MMRPLDEPFVIVRSRMRTPCSLTLKCSSGDGSDVAPRIFSSEHFSRTASVTKSARFLHSISRCALMCSSVRFMRSLRRLMRALMT